jgi:hypothetical protein
MHHAYLLLGEPLHLEARLSSMLKELSFERENNPDYYRFDGETFGIDEAREFSKRAGVRAFGERKVLVLAPARFTSEAQNALLKLLEEPGENTHFFILTRDKQVLIPTLLSRVMSVEVAGRGEEDSDAKSFLKMSHKDRILFAKDFGDSGKSLPVFIDSLLLLMKEGGTPLEKLGKVFAIRKFADDRAALPRLILEHLALVI